MQSRASEIEAGAAGVIDPPPTALQLFNGFLALGLTGFGGVLPMSHRMLVEKRRWLSDAEFTDLLGLCQFLPGGNIINLSVAVGLQFRGIRGALAAIIGLIAGPSLILIGLAIVYGHYESNVTLQHVFAGLAAAAAGLLAATALKIAAPLLGKPISIVIALLCFGAIAVLRLPLLPTMLILTPLSILAIWKYRS
ncbi:chromate transporter [Burkholderia sp. L27(2015)]|uniref:chromate transporter n=1 Tax=Burkholderia sp. L27(2015) TaxID=1641858 RepID=UPI00131B020D|nr:chromate transporter [Burkholderia sp. L27(2015)]